MADQQSSLSVFTLPAGTVCHRNGIPFKLQHATQIECHPEVWPLIKGDPPELEGESAPHKPAPFKPSAGAVATALKAARLALLSNDNCLITDRPDLPLSQETGWTTDFSSELALIDAAIGRTASLCANESTCLQTAPKSIPAKCEQELRSSRSPDQDRL